MRLRRHTVSRTPAVNLPAGHARVRRFRAGRAVAALAVSAGVIGLSACGPPPGPHVVSGVVYGNDGNFVNALIGFDVLDVQGHKINIDGNLGKTGYSALQRLNYCLPITGSASASPGCGGHAATKNFSITVPASAVQVYIEVYPKAVSNSSYIGPPGYNGYVGANAGTTDLTKYSMSYRREVPVTGSGATNVSIRMPKTCVQTGSLTGRVTGLPSGATGSVHAWSLEANNFGVLGMGLGKINADGTYRVDNLALGQHYSIIAASGSKSLRLVNSTMAKTSGTLVTQACQAKSFDLHF